MCKGAEGRREAAFRFYGVRLEGLAIGNVEVEQLRAFPELDHLKLSASICRLAADHEGHF
jgi:hypothetical protein